MEADEYKMGYNIGDVVGITQIFKWLLTTKDSRMLAVRLLQQSDPGSRQFSANDINDVIAIEHGVTTPMPENVKRVAERFRNQSDVEELDYWQHDKRVLAKRQQIEKHKPPSAQTSSTTDSESDRAYRAWRDDIMVEVGNQIFDARSYCLPACCFTESIRGDEVPADPTPIVSTSSTHLEDLERYIRLHPSDVFEQYWTTRIDAASQDIAVVPASITAEPEDGERECTSAEAAKKPTLV